jgi:hypothetical protein
VTAAINTGFSYVFLLKSQKNAVECTLLHSKHRHISATHVAIFRVVRFPSASMCSLYHHSPIWITINYMYLLCTSPTTCTCCVHHPIHVSAVYITHYMYLLCTSPNTCICCVHHALHVSAVYITHYMYLLCTSPRRTTLFIRQLFIF